MLRTLLADVRRLLDRCVAAASWFRCLARTIAPDAFAQAVLEAVNGFAAASRAEYFATAKKLGTPDQRRALTEALEAKHQRQ